MLKDFVFFLLDKLYYATYSIVRKEVIPIPGIMQQEVMLDPDNMQQEAISACLTFWKSSIC